jgi:hypothetical protein
MPMPTVLTKEPSISVMIAYAVCLLRLNKPIDQLTDVLGLIATFYS